MAKVFLVDDHEVVRRGVRDLLESEDDLEVVGEAGTGAEALARVGSTQPHVAVVDLRLPDMDGVEVCRELRSRHPELRCLILTSYADDEALIDAVMAGAAGYVLKQIKGNEIVDSVRRVARGESLLDAATTQRVMDRIRNGTEDERRLDQLSPQERRIFDLIGDGHSNREIADEMFLAEKTVKNYVSNLLMKMGMVRRTEVAAYAARLDERSRRPR
jgi:DNA-binding NarL/FixJ family response regulator